jgi:hypothetical protein
MIKKLKLYMSIIKAYTINKQHYSPKESCAASSLKRPQPPNPQRPLSPTQIIYYLPPTSYNVDYLWGFGIDGPEAIEAESLDLVPFLKESQTSMEWPSGEHARRIATYLTGLMKMLRPSMCFFPSLKMVNVYHSSDFGGSGPGIMFMIDAPSICFE